jgi:hypothetical protein
MLLVICLLIHSRLSGRGSIGCLIDWLVNLVLFKDPKQSSLLSDIQLTFCYETHLDRASQMLSKIGQPIKISDDIIIRIRSQLASVGKGLLSKDHL